MYNVPYFKEPDAESILRFMQQHPFIFLTGCNEGQEPEATQVPVLVDRRDDGTLVLTGHMMKGTGHYNAFTRNPHVLAVFTGPDTYVSPSWYTNPLQGGTWNYMSVHARGQIRFMEGPALYQVLERITAHFENNPDSPSLLHKLPPEYVERLAPAIMAFEITVTKLEHVFKLSQNRDAESYASIIRHLEARGGDAALIAAEMRKRQQGLFEGRE